MITIFSIVYAAERIKPPTPFSVDDPAQALSLIVGGIFQFLLIIAGFYALWQVIAAGYGIIASGGDKKALETARGTILWALVGLIVIAVAWGLVQLAQDMLGICLGIGCDIPLSES